jgi:hypothetical protein
VACILTNLQIQGGKIRLVAFIDKLADLMWQDKVSGLYFDKLANCKVVREGQWLVF